MSIVKSIIKTSVYNTIRIPLAAANGVVKSDITIALSVAKRIQHARVMFGVNPNAKTLKRMLVAQLRATEIETRQALLEEAIKAKKAWPDYINDITEISIKDMERAIRLSQLEL